MFKYFRLGAVSVCCIAVLYFYQSLYSSNTQLNLLSWADVHYSFPDEVTNTWYFKNVYAKEYESGFDVETKYQGNASAYIASKTAVIDKNSFGLLMQSFDPIEYRGQRVKIAAFIKTEQVTTKAALWGRADTLLLPTASFDNMSDRPIIGTTEWQPYAVVIDVPEDANNLSFGFYLVGTGKAWFDDVSISVVDQTTPLTGTYHQTMTREHIASAQQQQRARLTNRGFYDQRLIPSPEQLNFDDFSCDTSSSWRCGRLWHEGDSIALDINRLYGNKAPVKLERLHEAALPAQANDLVMYQKVNATAFRGKRIQISAIFRAQDVALTASIWARVVDQHDTVISADNMANRAVVGSTNWQRVSIEVNIPDEATSITFGPKLRGTGTLWLDSFKLESLGELDPQEKIWHQIHPSNLALELTL
ncbi:hypothetical protein [Pseudoalteromonas ulvae]|uniref:Uncharacterized protein n=1 Tax=Pseudoalteromonas ulvae TaxID=107327 RepID=A0A244CUP7_PSEDV|nr:hypothetical protein [Pseudoalteromonas ulvae]OUL59325.1 hypothetical protein B1199_03400 [Pseudoalteromonas ulvae]